MAEDNNNLISPQERVGKYEILGHIATGGMGAVYKARDTDLDRLVALKIVAPELSKQDKIIKRFRREAQAAAQLRHENIVAIFDVGEFNGSYYLAMEFIDGTDLQEYINRECRLDPEEARLIMIQAARALVHAHQNGIVHRDIKPSNFLLTIKDNNVQVKLADFGLAMRSESDDEHRITRDGTTVGTVDYMSPEQARNSQSADIRSDIYSLGCTFFHMLAGVAPFARGSLPERLILHMKKPPPDVRRLNKAVPETLVAIVNRMLEKKPEDRYQTPQELLHALENHEKIFQSNPGQGKPGPDGPKLTRGSARKQTIDPTIVMENKALDKESVEKPQVKETRAKNESVELVKEKARAETRSRKAPKETGPSIKKFETDEVDEGEEPDSEPVEKPIPSSARSLSKKEKLAKTRKKQASWWIYAGGGAISFFLLLLLLSMFLGGRPPRPREEPKPDPEPVAVIPEKKIDPVVTAVIDTSPRKMGPGLQPLLLMESTSKIDLASVRKDYYGTLSGFPEIPENSKVLQVRRLSEGGPNHCRTIAEALTLAEPKEWTVIEIHDDGPILIPALGALTQKSIVLRGATGYRPLLAWEVSKAAPRDQLNTKLCSLAQSKLVLENLDVVVKWLDEQPATLFELQNADFYARDCTFSLFCKSAQGISLIRSLPSREDVKEARSAQVLLQRCYVRGAEVTVLNAVNSSLQVLVEESLILGQNQPLLQLRERETDSFHFSCIRSTLVTGQLLLRWQSSSGVKLKPHVHGKILDSILSRNDPTSAMGDLIQLSDDAEPSQMSWRATNSVYVGWKKLLASSSKQINGNDLESWHRQWHYSYGDHAYVEPWPANPLSRLEEVPASMFYVPVPSALGYAAVSGPGPIGCAVGWLPADQLSWNERAYDLPLAPAFSLASPQSPPAIVTANDGFYHGEKIDLNKVEDLGVYLNHTLQKLKPAPRVVLHLTGKGTRMSSNIKIRGIQHLVLYFEPSKDAKEGLKLGINPSNFKLRTPLIEMVGGNLEVIGARIHLTPLTFASSIFAVQGGDLTLVRCWLQGPLPKSPDGFKSLISVSNHSGVPSTLWLRDSVLVSSRLLIHLQDQVQVKARNNLLLSLGDGLLYEGLGTVAALTHQTDYNTWAVRNTTFTLKTGPELLVNGTQHMFASNNAFLNPFADEADAAVLLRGGNALAARGVWTWQGRHNVYDARLHAYFGGLEKSSAARQTLKDWQLAWGDARENEPLLLDAGPTRKMLGTEGVTPESWLMQLDRLTLPKNLRGDPGQPPPGVDQSLLRIFTKKG